MSDPGPRPAVRVHRHPAAPAPVLRQVRAGVEEEGVPSDVVDVPGPAGATALAAAAAADSPLGVGIGLAADGAAAVQHRTLPGDRPVTTAPAGAGPTEWRRIGRVAARVVKRLPLG
ncbi:glycerol dehydratase reactivase beta/small subunit family protein [Geodermatophilus sp. DSM 44513]|uniref:glycerol dehydratase reactivase beta/small subunit family protein n=1 Tax=Geodermatophilus sp. DSM 44513 TaxID=1528104 RepID=UPI00127FF2CE|nr:glycerol dehydratase reactivase beta/small subunit family protein [Geodermatophilus sp. DSM 44513]WNV75952.1 glycerol dehydratase reactivase beta/small subunit family protein [Geodermatophilus sp. DSM 44513]